MDWNLMDQRTARLLSDTKRIQCCLHPAPCLIPGSVSYARMQKAGTLLITYSTEMGQLVPHTLPHCPSATTRHPRSQRANAGPPASILSFLREGSSARPRFGGHLLWVKIQQGYWAGVPFASRDLKLRTAAIGKDLAHNSTLSTFPEGLFRFEARFWAKYSRTRTGLSP